MLMELEHRIDHHVLRWGKTQLLRKELAQNLGRIHPSKLLKFVVALYNFVAFMQEFLVLRIF
jgi:hypothetical protein